MQFQTTKPWIEQEAQYKVCSFPLSRKDIWGEAEEGLDKYEL